MVKRVAATIKARGGHVIKTTGVKIAGTPDFLGTYRGIALALEIKRSHRHPPTPLQKRRLWEWHQAGAVTQVIWSPEQMTEILDNLDLHRGEWRPEVNW